MLAKSNLVYTSCPARRLSVILEVCEHYFLAFCKHPAARGPFGLCSLFWLRKPEPAL